MNGLAEAVCSAMGWADGSSLRARLDRVVPEVSKALGVPAARWSSDPRFLELVAERCTVPETYFFRHQEQLARACAEVVRSFGEAPLKVWSAACATGEEAYSLSMQLVAAGAQAERFTVLGTDVSETSLARARDARYPEWSFRGVPLEVRRRNFVRAAPGRFSVAARFVAPVRFAHHNLLAPAPVTGVHLISCRNVLIYLRPEAADAVLRQLVSALAPEGLLLIGAAEQRLAVNLGLEALEGDGGLLRKSAPGRAMPQAAARAAPSPPPPPAPARPCAHEAPLVERAWRALRAGALGEARALAERAAELQVAEAHLVLATLEEAAGEGGRALEALRRALYLDPQLITAHVSQARLYTRVGRLRDAQRARANALRYLEPLDPETPMRMEPPTTAGALRAALEAP